MRAELTQVRIEVASQQVTKAEFTQSVKELREQFERSFDRLENAWLISCSNARSLHRLNAFPSNKGSLLLALKSKVSGAEIFDDQCRIMRGLTVAPSAMSQALWI